MGVYFYVCIQYTPASAMILSTSPGLIGCFTILICSAVGL